MYGVRKRVFKARPLRSDAATNDQDDSNPGEGRPKALRHRHRHRPHDGITAITASRQPRQTLLSYAAATC
jgi:hypothetical protein